MKLTASLLSVFAGIGVGVASAATGDSSSLRSITDQQHRLLQDGNKDDEGFDKDTCENIAQIACGGNFQELCDHLSTSSSTLGKELTGGSWTVFFPTD
eukprot:CAMPEP_0170923678 /NCGR_PEP_ID=MMETSP0735-20130129/11184_1 /TAXON_ID=186038 /ORGANISM="Fragilariopsis kerguelensis, Strain L26-C5" /LENGTH=97 /DNA_ID=CAMNT_0011323319 /DNA_START=248 /DNA_END=538 /DNA_ORIENTATION=+